MLDLTRLEAGTAEIAVEPLPVRNVLAEVHDLTHVLASAKGLALRVASESDARVLADPQRLKQILLNLVGNALKFTSAGSVSVSAEAENGCVRFAVRDTGRGIAREQQALLFRKFMRLDTRMTAPEEGVGLGLSICRELVALMGGAIELSSDGPGAGTEVCFTLPRA
jgi:signal transduction histidine kinase